MCCFSRATQLAVIADREVGFDAGRDIETEGCNLRMALPEPAIPGVHPCRTDGPGDDDHRGRFGLPMVDQRITFAFAFTQTLIRRSKVGAEGAKEHDHRDFERGARFIGLCTCRKSPTHAREQEGSNSAQLHRLGIRRFAGGVKP